MNAGVPLGAGENGTSDGRVAEAAALLKQALDLLDQSHAPPELTARVQQAVDSVEEWRSA